MSTKTVVITGASTGIGRAIALRLDAAGWGVYAGVRSDDAGRDLAAAASPRLQPVLLDVTVPEQIAEVAARLDRELGSQGLGALVNNAGIPVGGPLDYLPVDELRRCFEVNTFAPIAMVQAFRDHLRAAHGRVVMVSSIAARVASPNMGQYSASKSALSALSEAMRAELRSAGIKIVVIEPGAIATPIWDKAGQFTDSLRSSLPPAALQHHDKMLAHTEKGIAKAAKNAVEVDEVAKVVEKALTARFPKSRYLVGRDAKVAAAIFRVVPDRVRTSIVRRI